MTNMASFQPILYLAVFLFLWRGAEGLQWGVVNKAWTCPPIQTCNYHNAVWTWNNKKVTNCFLPNRADIYKKLYRMTCETGYLTADGAYYKEYDCNVKMRIRTQINNWEPAVVGCTVKITSYCPPVPSIANGRLLSTGTSRVFGATFSVMCNPHYSQNGDGYTSVFTTTCTKRDPKRGVWSNSPNCSPVCPSGYRYDQTLKRCITIITTATVNYENARDRCDNIKGSLVHIRSANENARVQSLVTNSVTLIALQKMDVTGWAWLMRGVVYEQQSARSYSNWQQTYPRSGSGHCTLMNAAGKWYNSHCGTQHQSMSIICETETCWRSDYNWDGRLGRCVKLHYSDVSWKDARQGCNVEQASLIQVFSPEDRDTVRIIMGRSSVWLGLNRAPLSKDPNWFWRGMPHKVPDTKLSAQLYIPMDTSASGGNCAVMTTDDRWQRLECTSKQKFMCQLVRCPVGYTFQQARGRCIQNSAMRVAPASGKCPRSDYTWSEVQGMCVKYSTVLTSWYTAQRKCAADGAKMLRVQNGQQESDVLNTNQGVVFWMGLNDIHKEGHFVFEGFSSVQAGTSGNPYRNWASKEPNGGTRENCVVIGSQRWRDMPCSGSFALACELPPVHV